MEKVLQLPQQKRILARNVIPRVAEKTVLKEKNVVQEIFAQVDEALKKRKLENLNLHDEVIEKEQQLTHLQQQTKEMSIANTSFNSAVESLRNALYQLDEHIQVFNSTTLEQIKNDCHRFDVSHDSAKNIVVRVSEDEAFLKEILSELSLEVSSVKQALTEKDVLFEKKKARLFKIHENIKCATEVQAVQLSQLECLKSELKECQEKRSSAQSDCEVAMNRASEVSLITTQKSELQRQLTDFMNAKTVEVANFSQRVDTATQRHGVEAQQHIRELDRLRRATDEFTTDSYHQEKQCKDLQHESDVTKEEMASLSSRLQSQQIAHASLQSELAGMAVEISQLRERVTERQTEIELQRQRERDQQQRQERFYSLTCEAIKEIKELHLQVAASEQEVMKVEAQQREGMFSLQREVEHLREADQQHRQRLADTTEEISLHSCELTSLQEKVQEEINQCTLKRQKLAEGQTAVQHWRDKKISLKERAQDDVQHIDDDDNEDDDSSEETLKHLLEQIASREKTVIEMITEQSDLDQEITSLQKELTSTTPMSCGAALLSECDLLRLEEEAQAEEEQLKEEVRRAFESEMSEIQNLRAKLSGTVISRAPVEVKEESSMTKAHVTAVELSATSTHHSCGDSIGDALFTDPVLAPPTSAKTEAPTKRLIQLPPTKLQTEKSLTKLHHHDKSGSAFHRVPRQLSSSNSSSSHHHYHHRTGEDSLEKAVARGQHRALQDSEQSSSMAAPNLLPATPRQPLQRAVPKTATLPLSQGVFKSIAVKVARGGGGNKLNKTSPNDWFEDDAAFY